MDTNDLRQLDAFVTNPGGSVYCIKNLPEEVVAVLFAYVSRNPDSIQLNLLKMLQQQNGDGAIDPAMFDLFDLASEKAAKFHEKWVVGYGHASVAEHAVLHYGIEGISILATKVLEDARLAAYTEKSTRYQFFGKDTFYLPESLEQYRPDMNRLMEDYRNLFGEVYARLEEKYPPKEDLNDEGKAYFAALKAQTCDAVRGLLPAGTKTMLGMTVNAREAAYVISKLLSNPLQECQDLGREMLAEGRKVCPTLFRHAEASDALKEFSDHVYHTPRADYLFEDSKLPALKRNEVKLIRSWPDSGDATEFLSRAERYEHSNAPMEAMANCRVEDLKTLAACDGGHLNRIRQIMNMDAHAAPPRFFELMRFVFEITCDYGAFRDIQRHRIGTQLSPLFTASLGYEVPEEILNLGLQPLYAAAIERVKKAYLSACEGSGFTDCQYLLPMAFRKRLLVDWDLREVIHFIRLRSGPQGHISYRKIAWSMRDQILAKFPELEPFVTADTNEYPLGRMAAYVSETE